MENDSDFVTNTELNNKKYLTSIPEEYITSAELLSKGYLDLEQTNVAIDNAINNNNNELLKQNIITFAAESETGHIALNPDIPVYYFEYVMNYINSWLDFTLNAPEGEWILYFFGRSPIGEATATLPVKISIDGTTEIKPPIEIFSGHPVIYYLNNYGFGHIWKEITPVTEEELDNKGYLTSLDQNIEEVAGNANVAIYPNNVYKLDFTGDYIGANLWFCEPENKDIVNQALIYINNTLRGESVVLSWGRYKTTYPSDNQEDRGTIEFINGEIPTIGMANYRVVAEFNPFIDNWVVGVIQDGAEGGVN